LVKELKSGNSNINDGGKVYNVDANKNYVNEENSSNIILTKQKNNGNYDENKKKATIKKFDIPENPLKNSSK